MYQEEKSRIHILTRFEDAFQGESQNTLKAGLSLEAGRRCKSGGCQAILRRLLSEW